MIIQIPFPHSTPIPYLRPMTNPKISKAQLGFSEELSAFQEYIKSTSSEKAKHYSVYQ